MSMEDDFDLIWHDPPPTGRWGPRLERFTNKLAERPNEWGELPLVNGEGYPISVATSLRKNYEGKGFEFRTTTLTPGNSTRIRIFGRFVREDDPEHAAKAALKPVR